MQLGGCMNAASRWDDFQPLDSSTRCKRAFPESSSCWLIFFPDYVPSLLLFGTDASYLRVTPTGSSGIVGKDLPDGFLPISIFLEMRRKKMCLTKLSLSLPLFLLSWFLPSCWWLLTSLSPFKTVPRKTLPQSHKSKQTQGTAETGRNAPRDLRSIFLVLLGKEDQKKSHFARLNG